MSDLILETRPCLQLRRGRGRSMDALKIGGSIPFFSASADLETDAGTFSGKIARSLDRFSLLFSYIFITSMYYFNRNV